MQLFNRFPRMSVQFFQRFKPILALCLVLGGSIFGSIAVAQSTISPPSLGQETKGKPAIAEEPSSATTQSLSSSEAEKDDKSENKATNSRINNVLGHTTVKESKRETGQIYLIELEHSSGSKQYIEETGSDGKIESTSNDIEETPNLPKWKIGSW